MSTAPWRYTVCLTTLLASIGLWGCKDQCEPRCDGDTRVYCQESADGWGTSYAKYEYCPDNGNVCVETGGAAYCVDATLTRCTEVGYALWEIDPSGCNAERLVTPICTEATLLANLWTPCAEGTRCFANEHTAACVAEAMMPCDPWGGDVPLGCSTDGSELVEGACTSVGYLGEMIPRLCDEGEVCMAAYGSAACVDPALETCDPATWPRPSHCENNTVVGRACAENHYVVEVQEPCFEDLPCVEKDDWADCSLIPLEPCTPGLSQSSCENNIARTVYCNSIGYADEAYSSPCGELVCTMDEYGDAWCQ
jgi:hypothetical protein